MNIGDKAPEVLGINEKGVEIRLSDYKGKKIVLYFYPKDMTSGCTAQACNLRDNYADLRKAGYEVIGVSVDSEKSHQKFIEKNNLPFTLIADTDKKLVEQFSSSFFATLLMFNDYKICAAWSLVFTSFGVMIRSTIPSSLMMKVVRNVPIYLRPYMLFSPHTPKEVKNKDHAAQIL